MLIGDLYASSKTCSFTPKLVLVDKQKSKKNKIKNIKLLQLGPWQCEQILCSLEDKPKSLQRPAQVVKQKRQQLIRVQK